MIENEDQKVIWYPQKGSQELFLKCPLPEVLYEGTRGNGKTDVLIMDFCQFVGRGFGASWRGILFRKASPHLKDVISRSRKWIHQIFPKATYNQVGKFWRFPEGEMFYFSHFDGEEDYWQYHGHEYPWIAWEELCTWNTDVGYKRMMSCNRSSHEGIPIRYRATTNPYGVGHNWVKSRFMLPERRLKPIIDSIDLEGNPEPARVAISGSVYENKILLKSNPDYIERIQAAASSKAELEAWLFANWNIVAGGMFDDVWSPKEHILKPFVIPDTWRIDRSFDWGSSKPFSVGWWAESDGSDVIDGNGETMHTVKGDLFRIGEWYGWTGKPNKGLRMMDAEISKGIIQREYDMGIGGRVKAGVADSSIFDPDRGQSIAQIMQKPVKLDNEIVYNGASFLPADKKAGSRVAGWSQVRQRLKNAKKPKTGIRENEGMFIFDTCDQFLRTIPVLPRDKKNMDDVDTDAEDHIADEVRYRVRASMAKTTSGKTRGHV